MWYTGRHVDTTVTPNIDIRQIGYATSPDGVTWTRQNGGNPVLTPSTPAAWDDGQVYYAWVIKDGTTYKMWYTGFSTFEAMGYATSTDGISWTRSGSPILMAQGTGFEATSVGAPSVIKDGTTYRMWYTGFNNSGSGATEIGYAESTDGLAWSRFAGNPVIPRGAAGTWDAAFTWFPSALRDGNIFKIWYTGLDSATAPQNYRIGYATNP
jgi:predicted GH43/DUF377 family glycosyl hydrolase